MTDLPPKQAWALACLLSVTGALLVLSVMVTVWLASLRE